MWGAMWGCILSDFRAPKCKADASRLRFDEEICWGQSQRPFASPWLDIFLANHAHHERPVGASEHWIVVRKCMVCRFTSQSQHFSTCQWMLPGLGPGPRCTFWDEARVLACEAKASMSNSLKNLVKAQGVENGSRWVWRWVWRWGQDRGQKEEIIKIKSN